MFITSTKRVLPSPFMTLSLAFFAAIAVSLMIWPEPTLHMCTFVVESLISVSPIIIPGIIVAAWIISSGASAKITKLFEGRQISTVFLASMIGAVTPICGITVLPLMVGLLAGGIPLAPVMAFWLSSPVTDPAMLAVTAATLGMHFAIGKTVAAFLIGVFGGLASLFFAKHEWSRNSLRQNFIVGSLGAATCGSEADFQPAVWREQERRSRFSKEAWSVTRLILICLIPAFAAEYLLNAILQPEALSAYFGSESWWAIPVAVFVGAPVYLNGYAALPLARGLMELGASPGAAMSFLVSGGVISVWGAMAIFPVLRLKPFLLYLSLAITGSMAAGWLFELVV